MVGRIAEIKKLETVYHSNRAEFVGVYGRRRVGKTYLVNETFADRFVFRHNGLSPIKEEQNEGEALLHFGDKTV